MPIYGAHIPGPAALGEGDVRLNNVKLPPYDLEVSEKQTSKHTRVQDVASSGHSEQECPGCAVQMEGPGGFCQRAWPGPKWEGEMERPSWATGDRTKASA